MKAEYRNVLSENKESLRVVIFEDREFPAAWHFHPQYELTYIISSSGMRYVGDSVSIFGAGDLVLVGANLPHSWKTVGEQTARVKAVIIQWNEDLLGANWILKTEFSSIGKMLRLAARGLKFPAATAAKFEAAIISLSKLPAFERMLGFLQILQGLSKQKDYLLLSSSSFNTNITTQDSDRISVIQAYVKNNIHAKITVGDVASLIGLTEVSFCRYFRKVHNKTFITFLNEYRIALACKMLVETDHTVSEIGYECGFYSISLFHRLFYRLIHCTPLEYRRSYQSISAR